MSRVSRWAMSWRPPDPTALDHSYGHCRVHAIGIGGASAQPDRCESTGRWQDARGDSRPEGRRAASASQPRRTLPWRTRLTEIHRCLFSPPTSSIGIRRAARRVSSRHFVAAPAGGGSSWTSSTPTIVVRSAVGTKARRSVARGPLAGPAGTAVRSPPRARRTRAETVQTLLRPSGLGPDSLNTGQSPTHPRPCGSAIPCWGSSSALISGT